MLLLLEILKCHLSTNHYAEIIWNLHTPTITKNAIQWILEIPSNDKHNFFEFCKVNL